MLCKWYYKVYTSFVSFVITVISFLLQNICSYHLEACFQDQSIQWLSFSDLDF